MMARESTSHLPRTTLVATELVAAALVAAGFAYLAWVGLGYRSRAAYLPVAVSALGGLSALIWALQSLRRLAGTTGTTEISVAGVTRILVLVLGAIIFVLLIPHLGFFTGSLLFMLGSTLAMGQRPLWQPITAAVILPVMLWLIFSVLLNNYLPPDLIFGN